MIFLCPRPFCHGSLIKDLDSETMICILCGREFAGKEISLDILEEYKKGNYRRPLKWIVSD
jgi:hypothetical protein